MSVDVTVIGGGVSGLTAAYELMRLGHSVVVLERQIRVGGKAQSERIGAFLMEHGPSSVAAEGTVSSLAGELGLDSERVDLAPVVRNRYIVADGRLRGIAIHPAAFVTGGFLSAAGRLRLLAEAVIPRRADDAEETIAAFCRRRFGSEFTDRVIDSLVCGMFAGTADRLSMGATFPRLVEMERAYGSVLRAMIAGHFRGRRMPARRLFSWRDGIASLPGALSARLGSCVKVGVTVRRIAADPRGFVVDTAGSGCLRTRAVVIATQPHVTGSLLEELDSDAAHAVAQIEAPPLAVVFLGYAREQIAHPIDGIGFLAPRRERRRLNGALFCSSMFAGRAPAGYVSLAAYLGGDRAPDLARRPADEITDMARQEFADLLDARGAPVLVRVRHWPRGLPQYCVGHRNRLAFLRRASERWPGLFITGNYLAGVSVGACVAHATQVATGVNVFLRQRAPQLVAPKPEQPVLSTDSASAQPG